MRRLSACLFVLLALGSISGRALAEELDIRPDEAGDLCDENARQLRVTVAGIQHSEGILTVELYRNEQRGFLRKKGRLRRVREAASEGEHTVCMNLASADLVAVAVYHDEDGDRDLDQKWNKMPKEPFGLSNNPKLRLGFPPIEPSLIAIEPGGADIVIDLREAE
ncbi:DUF2141 domain-containing protein [Parvularcula maris]|uniref:DUF2141 domain-containing protein n=1 Tax=Parvularcula maris TaxID=2965077 RepID=A0A9X2LD33_9PROT|nr:DUF2141 domain-containing protein [Parvularcula maris]MCQ8186322.1 DUF2141 domain-containing protein [Parvularcula maris]